MLTWTTLLPPHLDSIRSIGSRDYKPEIVSAWGAQIRGELYAKAMARGEAFVIAVGQREGAPAVLGFSSHRIDASEHSTAVYVRTKAVRRGVGSALLRAAEASALAATSIDIDAALVAGAFYKAHGFEEIGRGRHALASGLSMACAFVRKRLTSTNGRHRN